MKKFVAIFALVCASSVFAGTSLYAPWYYDTDGCTKVYPYGFDSSECKSSSIWSSIWNSGGSNTFRIHIRDY